MSASTVRPLEAGIYAPLPTFFQSDSEDLGMLTPSIMICVAVPANPDGSHSADVQAQAAHAVRLAKAGVKPLLAGTMGEAHHLLHDERVTLIKATRTALDDAGFNDIPIISGSGAGSTRETIQISKEAAEAGADYVIVICSGYFAGALANNRKALKAFWSDVAEQSPLPVIIYNCG